MSISITPDFIRAIPKTDLHLHLDGSLRLSSLIEMAREAKVELPSYEEAGLKETVFKSHYADLPEYLHGFKYTCAVLQTAENLERAAYELAQDNIAEGVRYIEVRFAPQLHITADLDAKTIMRAVCRGLERARREHTAGDNDVAFAYGVITCALRSFNSRMGRYYARLLSVLPRAPRKEVFAIASLEAVREAVELRDEEGLPLVGFDLAGEESGYPASAHIDAFTYAHDHFMLKTIHAGEAYGPESIFQALTSCHATRIGHGTFLFDTDAIQDASIEDRERYVENLAEHIANRRITIEACVTSNLQTTPGIGSVSEHPLRRMLDHNLSISICTDNRLVSDTTVSRELELVADHLAPTPHQFRNLILAGFKGSFFPGSYTEKRRYVRGVINRYEQLAAEHLSG